MAHPAEKNDQSLEKLLQRIGELEKRVAALENRSQTPAKTPTEPVSGQKPPEEKEKREKSTSIIPVFGKAVLAIAGAYLLRAMADASVAPRLLLQMLAIVYAGAWLVTAARTHQKSVFASTVFALTSAAILAPLLWEGTARFHQLPTVFTSAVLVSYVILSLALAWKEKLRAIPWISFLVAIAMMLALLVATHELKTLTISLLVIALIAEFAGLDGRWLGLRVVAAFGANSALLVLGLIMTSEEGVPSGYQPMSVGEITALGAALLLIYTVSLAVRGYMKRMNWNFAEVAQAVVSFVSGTWLILHASQESGAVVLGSVFLLVALVCYWGVLRRFTPPPLRQNQRVSSIFAIVLVLFGSFLALRPDLRTVLLSITAVAALLVFKRTTQLSFEIHGTVYLLAACTVSGLFTFATKALIGSLPAWPVWTCWIAACAGLLGYFLAPANLSDRWIQKPFSFLSAGIVALAAAALTVVAFAKFSNTELSLSQLSMVRTIVTSVMALALAYIGSRWNHTELGWVAYATIGLGALKLVVEDLRFGNAGTLMISLLCYGLILILLPRITRFGRVEV